MKLRIVIAGMILMGFVLDGYGQRYYEKELLSTRLERKEMRQKASVADGGYVLFQGGLRKHENSSLIIYSPLILIVVRKTFTLKVWIISN